MMSQTTQILIVEDDHSIAEGLALNLRLEGYTPEVIHDGQQALERILASPPDLILLDLTLPGKDGLELLRELKEKEHHCPVIVLSAREIETDKVAALRLGADDYVTKPFGLAELMARVDAVLRRTTGTQGTRSHKPDPETIPTGDGLELDFATRTVWRSGQEIKLTHLEFELLSYFAQNPSRVIPREELLRKVWRVAPGSSQRTVDNFVAQLRSKLEDEPEDPRHFITVRGAGYRFDP